jgi:putative NADH-flavin reductase
VHLLLLGATGRTGGELLTQALAQGHHVTALVRDPGKIPVEHGRLRVVTGDASDAAAVDQATDGQDAVLCALGPSSPKALLSCDLMRTSICALVTAMDARGVKRLVLLSALGVGRSADRAPKALRLVFRTLFRQVGKDKTDGEERLAQSDLDWTLVYPPSLTNEPLTGEYQHGESLELTGLPKIGRADVANFMLAQLADATYARKAAIVSY